MKARKQLLSSPGYWYAKMQIDLFRPLKEYKDKNRLSFANLEHITGVDIKIIRQMCNGDYDGDLLTVVQVFTPLGIGVQLEFKYIEKS